MLGRTRGELMDNLHSALTERKGTHRRFGARGLLPRLGSWQARFASVKTKAGVTAQYMGTILLHAE